MRDTASDSRPVAGWLGLNVKLEGLGTTMLAQWPIPHARDRGQFKLWSVPPRRSVHSLVPTFRARVRRKFHTASRVKCSLRFPLGEGLVRLDCGKFEGDPGQRRTRQVEIVNRVGSLAWSSSSIQSTLLLLHVASFCSSRDLQAEVELILLALKDGLPSLKSPINRTSCSAWVKCALHWSGKLTCSSVWLCCIGS